MSKLTKTQIAFLKSQGISAGQVFDASACRRKAEREAQMEELGLYFYSGGALCAKGGHSLRTKAGHCMQCNPANVAYQLRSVASGYIYLAHSAATGLVKIGFTKLPPHERAKDLRKHRYANVADWEIKEHKKVDRDAGKIEFSIHAALDPYQKVITYHKGFSQTVECREVFACELRIAVEVFFSAVT
jgi:hypothetical protein